MGMVKKSTFFIEETPQFLKWLMSLSDIKARAHIDARIAMIQENGHFGDIKSVGGTVFELRFFFGPGYRIYYTHRGNSVVFLLAGGDKSTQAKNIQTAIELASTL